MRWRSRLCEFDKTEIMEKRSRRESLGERAKHRTDEEQKQGLGDQVDRYGHRIWQALKNKRELSGWKKQIRRSKDQREEGAAG